MSKAPTRNFEATSNQLLADPEVAALYLEEILRDGDLDLFKEALRDVATANVGGMSALAEKASLNREQLYRSLSRKGNPRLDTLTRVLDAAGLRLSVTAVKAG
jgi:probable addiction module antidote protein